MIIKPIDNVSLQFQYTLTYMFPFVEVTCMQTLILLVRVRQTNANQILNGGAILTNWIGTNL
jgi:hypothetical protein